MVRSLIQTTDAVSARDAWSYWKDTVLPTIEGIRVVEDQPFGAQRSITALTGGIILDTASSPVLVHRSAQRLAHDYAGYVALTLFVEGHGLTDPRDIGGKPLAKGDIALCDLSRPYKAAGLTDYRELRLYMPRASFDERIGNIDDLIDLKISATAPLASLFFDYFKGVCDKLPDLSQNEANAGIDGAIHLLSLLVSSQSERLHDQGEQTSGEAVLRLANKYITKMLHDPSFDGATLMRTIGVSRSKLYRAFYERGGVAAAIRDARLDRARQRLVAPFDRALSLSQVAHLCGFDNYVSFSHAFRRRFGMSPGDVRRWQDMG